MPARQVRDTARPRPDTGPAAPQRLRRGPERCEPQFLGMLLIPAQAGLVAVDPQPQRIVLAGRDLAGPQRTLRAAVEAQHDLNIIVEAPARYEVRQLRGHTVSAQARHELDQVIGVGTDVTEAAAHPGP